MGQYLLLCSSKKKKKNICPMIEHCESKVIGRAPPQAYDQE